MAERRAPGLTFGQIISLTFGFLLASVVIFVFGMWVGSDLAEQQAAKQRQVARLPIAPPEPAPARPAGVQSRPAAPPAYAARTVAPALAPTPTATTVPTARPTAPPTRPPAPPTASTVWTVQAYATNDTVRAVMLARTLRSKGYDATTATKDVGGTTWYLVRVGRYRDRAAAKAMESKLRSEEGLEAASVAPAP